MSAVMLMAVNVKAVNAVAKLTLSPASGSYGNGETFKVTVGVDSGTDVAGAVDGLGTYDSAKLELTDISEATDLIFKNGGSQGSCSTKKSDGKFNFTCYGESSVDDKIIKGNLVVLTFKTKAAGTAAVNFTCASGSTSDSNIIKSSTSTDVITCASNDSGSYTISGTASTTTPTTTATTVTPTKAATSSTELPKTGAVGSTIGLIVFGLFSVAGAFFLKFL